MKVFIVNKSKNDIGCTVTRAKLYNKKDVLIGTCIDTPNSIATVFNYVPGIYKVLNGFGEIVTTTKSRIEQCKGNPIEFCEFNPK